MNTRSYSGFTLIELLVVVAIIGILAAVGILAYSGYVEAAKKKSAENVMLQIGLAQTEYYSDYSIYYVNGATCTPVAATSRTIEKNLLGGDGINPTIITEDIGFNMCIEISGSGYLIKAINDNTGCQITVDVNQAITRNASC